jgi:RNA polymerase sigma-70 factor (ECF subfamily)
MESFAHSVLEPARRQLNAYLCRLVLRPQVAAELVQTTFLRALENVETVPPEPERARAWLFKVATNLAIDEQRRHARWRETLVFDLREVAEASPDFVARSRELVGSPETKAIAREHLVACFACTLNRLPERRAAALLLKEVAGFTMAEVAEILESTEAQAKNWLQEARAEMVRAYATTCALVSKGGVCHQCVELDGAMKAGQGLPLVPGAADLDARLTVLRAHAEKPWGTWHAMLFQLVDEIG